MRTSLALAALVLTAACRDAASEAPVDLKPGLYDIAATGESYIEIEPSSKSGQKCFSDYEAREFARFPMGMATRKWDGCSDTNQPRQGNLVTGQRYCTIASFRDDDERVMTYRAEISTDGFAILGETKDKEDGSGPETGPWRVIGRRVGDCPAGV